MVNGLKINLVVSPVFKVINGLRINLLVRHVFKVINSLKIKLQVSYERGDAPGIKPHHIIQ